MQLRYYFTILTLTIQTTFFCQGFNLTKSGLQTFYFNDPKNRNQISFTSETSLENFQGITSDIWGEINLDPINVEKTISGEIFIASNSLKTGIEERDENLLSSSWLNSEKYPSISFKIQSASQIKVVDNNKVKLVANGLFTCHGKSKVIEFNVTLVLQEENDLTKKRLPGDLLSVVAEFDINLSDYGIKNSFIPQRVSNKQKIKVNIVGTNVKPE